MICVLFIGADFIDLLLDDLIILLEMDSLSSILVEVHEIGNRLDLLGR